VRLDIAEQLEQGEEKLATAESLQRKADKRLKNADKDEQRAEKLIEEVTEQRELAAKESKKAQALRKEGNAALAAAKAEYEAISSKPAVDVQGAGDSNQ
jgi:long-subunit acyl-CoA synthetase (AMP-forming)